MSRAAGGGQHTGPSPIGQTLQAQVTRLQSSGANLQVEGFRDSFWLPARNMRLPQDAQVDPQALLRGVRNLSVRCESTGDRGGFVVTMRDVQQDPNGGVRTVGQPDRRSQAPGSSSHAPSTAVHTNATTTPELTPLSTRYPDPALVHLPIKYSPQLQQECRSLAKGQLLSNHFIVKHGQTCTLYLYHINNVLKPRTVQNHDGNTAGPAASVDSAAQANTSAPANTAAPANAAATPNSAAPANTPTPGNAVSPANAAAPTSAAAPANAAAPATAVLHDANLRARQTKRLIHLLINQLAVHGTDITSNYKDKIVSSRPLAGITGASTDVSVTYYEEDQLRPANVPNPTTYTVRIGRVEVVDVAQHAQYLQNLPNAQATYADEAAFNLSQGRVTDVLNMVFSRQAHIATIRSARNPSGWTEPSLSDVGPNKFFGLASLGDVRDEAGLIAARGIFRSTRGIHGEGLLYNVNTTTGAFYAPVRLDTLITSRLRQIGSQRQPKRWKELELFIKGLRVRTNYVIAKRQLSHEQIYTVHGLADTFEYWDALRDKDKVNIAYKWQDTDNARKPIAATVRFLPKLKKSGEGKESSSQPVPITVKAYFATEDVADNEIVVRLGRNGPLLPARLLEVLPGQFWKQTTDLTTVATVEPPQNRDLVQRSISSYFDLQTNHGDETRNSEGRFGITLLGDNANTPLLKPVDAIKLPLPRLLYRDSRVRSTQPQIIARNQWFTTNLKANVPDFNDDKERLWGVCEIYTSSRGMEREHYQNAFTGCLQRGMEQHGIANVVFDNEWWGISVPGLMPDAQGLAELEDKIRQAYDYYVDNASHADSKPYAFVVVVLPKKDAQFYAIVHRLAEIAYGLNILCAVRGKDGNGSIITGFNEVGTMMSKINLKSSSYSCNHRWEHKQPLLGGDTMVVGMDVTHPGVGSLKHVPSIAAMVANIDPHFAQWPASLRENPRPRILESDTTTIKQYKKSIMEKITNLDDMLKERLDRFRHFRNNLPSRIIFYRDGLSESQFEMCVKEELPQLNSALAAMYTAQDKPLPEILVVCAVKRHHTRFYPGPATDQQILYAKPVKNNQAPPPRIHPVPGATIFQGVTNGKWQDFFLFSQVPLLGTTRPTHYVVLHSTLRTNTTILEIAKATYDLCFQFGRCNMSVGVTAPAYLADKACDRARCYARDQYVGNGNVEYNRNNPAHRINLAVSPLLSDQMYYI